MSLATWHCLTLLMTFVSYPKMSVEYSPYVSKFEYTPRFHPSKNPDCPLRFDEKKFSDDFEAWNRPAIEVRAVLSSCSQFEDKISARDSFNFRRESSYEEQNRGTISNCTQKILISMRFNNIGKTSLQEKFIVIDHVLDPISMKKIPLRNRYVIKIRQELVLQLYGLKFQSVSVTKHKRLNFLERYINIMTGCWKLCWWYTESCTDGRLPKYQQSSQQNFAGKLIDRSTLNKVVNAEAREEVINNENLNYKGCNADLDSPTCGQTYVRGEPVPFSQGFCCSCDSEETTRRQWTLSNVSALDFHAKSNYVGANKPRNRLTTTNEPASLDTMAERQRIESEVRSSTKSFTGETTARSTKTIEEPCLGKNSRDRVKCLSGSRNRVSKGKTDYLSTPGSSPSVDEMEWNSGESRRQSNLANKKAGKATDTANKRDRVKGHRSGEDRSRDGSVAVVQIFAGSSGLSFNAVNRKNGDNRDFQLSDSKAGIRKFADEGKGQVTGSKDSSTTAVIRIEAPFRSTGYSAGKNARATSAHSVKETEGRRRTKIQAESIDGNKGKKRNKALHVTSSIDSLAIRASMHLNEPLKNLSTGVLNKRRDGTGVQGFEKGNLNRVMESTLPDITAKSFNEKHGTDGYFQSNVNEGNKRISSSNDLEGVRKDKLKLLSKLLISEENVSLEDNSLEREKKLLTQRTIKNYTPLKRTLKDLSYRGDYHLRDSRNWKKRDTSHRRSKRNFKRFKRRFRRRRHSQLIPRRSRRLKNRLKRDKKGGENDGKKNSKIVQVYVDASRLGNNRSKDRSRAGTLKEKESSKGEKKVWKDNQRDNVDKQIEEKFSRISDALKEDEMGKAIMQNTTEGGIDEIEETPKDATESQYNFDEVSRQGNNEASHGKQLNEIQGEKIEGFNGNAQQNRFVNSEQLIKNGNQADTKEKLQPATLKDEYLSSSNEAKGSASNKLNKQINENKGFTSSKLVILPTEKSGINDRNQTTHSSFSPQLTKNATSGYSRNENSLENTTKESAETVLENTQAIIVIDLFKVATDPLVTTPSQTSRSGNQIQKAVTSTRTMEKAFAAFVPVHRTLETPRTTTLTIEESTTMLENVTKVENLTTIVEATKITDETFRPSVKPPEYTVNQTPGGAEFHQEIDIDEITFPDETNAPTTSNLQLFGRQGLVDVDSMAGNTWAMDENEQVEMNSFERKEKRTTPSVIKKKDSSGNREAKNLRDERSLYDRNPEYYGRKVSTLSDLGMKFSFEAGNVDLVREKVGVTSSFVREQQNYVQLKVDGPKEPKKASSNDKLFSRKRKTKKKYKADKFGVRGKGQNNFERTSRRRKESDNVLIKHFDSVHHPWYLTTETSEYTVKQKDFDRVSSNGKLPKEAGNLEHASGRILSPCAKKEGHRMEYHGENNVNCEAKMNKRSRRLLSVQRLKETKGTSNHQSSKDRKKIHEEDASYVKDAEDEYTDTSEHGKRLKSVRDKDQAKSKKRDTSRLKRKKEDKSRSKKQSRSSVESSDDYDYFMPDEEDYDEKTYLEERQVDANNAEDLGSYDASLSLNEKDVRSKTSGSFQEDNSYNQLIDHSVPIDFDEDNTKMENRARSNVRNKGLDAEIQDGRVDDVGKDFEISLTGKIHLESDSNGRPVSISFNAAPELLRKDSISDGKANGFGNRVPSEPESSIIDVSDVLDVATSNANFFSDAQPPLNVPIDPIIDRPKEYYPIPAHDSSRYPVNYENEPSEERQVLRLKKKSVRPIENPVKRDTGSVEKEAGIDSKTKEESTSFNEHQKDENFVPVESEMKEEPDVNLDDSSWNFLASGDDGVKNSLSDSLIDPQISIDLSDMPENSLASVDLENPKNLAESLSVNVSDSDSGSCFRMPTTLQKVDMPETTTISDKMGAESNNTFLSFHDYDTYANVTETNEQSDGIATPIVLDESKYPKSAAVQASHNISETKVSGENNNESAEKKNMLAVAEFVKKLEKLTPDSENSSINDTGRTLIHLKKYIVIPDNSSHWTVKELAGSKNLSQNSSTDGVIAKQEGAVEEKSWQESSESEVGQESNSGNSNMIKEIISSVIEGEDLKRDTAKEKLNPAESLKEESAVAKMLETPLESGLSEGKDEQDTELHLEVEKNLKDLAKLQEETSTGVKADSKGDTGHQFLRANSENAREPSKKSNDVCGENKSNIKEKRETTASNGNSVSPKGGQKKHGKRKDVKKKRRKKRKKKLKKNSGKKNKKDAGKSKSRWPFKRNLLMLAEKEHATFFNEHDKSGRNVLDKFAKNKGDNNDRFVRKLKQANEVKEPHIRGGQNCGNFEYPPDVDPVKYLESTHCLRFSDLWYSVYQLEEPIIDHKVHVQIFEKRSSPDGSVSWSDLTNGSTIRLGTFERYYKNKEDTLAFSYNDIKIKSNAGYNLDPVKDRLLIPSILTGKRSMYPQAEEWSGEYLVVHADKINEDANECDKAGVGFAAFVGQPDRCERVTGTCLKNQPLAYWRHDMEARESGRSGCYFLSNFAWVPSEAIKYNVNGTGSREFLALEYHSPHVSVIDVELRADYNALLRPGSSGRLTEIYVDNTGIDYTMITVLVTNKGSFSSSYRTRITDCPKGLPASWLNAESSTKIIAPRRNRKITLDLYGRLSVDEFSCSVLLLDRYGEPIATRKMKVRKMDYCFCVQHCTCSCLSDDHRKSCEPMLLESYHAAGFHGPIPTTSVESIWSSPIAIVSLFITTLLSLLFLMGLLKWAIGMCVPAVSRWGLDTLLDAGKMNEYFEKDLKSSNVVFDFSGAPVHPDTGLRTVRICNRKLEFFLNLMFFFIYPFTICCCYCIRSERSSRSTSSDETKVKTSLPRSESRLSYSEKLPRTIKSRVQTSLMSEKDESPAMICVSTYEDSINSKMEADDTKYVIDELKKSQESLQNHNRYRGSDQFRKDNSSSD